MTRSRALLKAAMWADSMRRICGDVGFRGTLPAPGTAEQYHMWEEMADIFRTMARESAVEQLAGKDDDGE